MHAVNGMAVKRFERYEHTTSHSFVRQGGNYGVNLKLNKLKHKKWFIFSIDIVDSFRENV